MRDPVRGSLYVVDIGPVSDEALYSTFRLQGVIRADGVPATAVERTGTAPTAKWPQPGVHLPVLVDRAEPSRMRILWDEVPTRRQTALDTATHLAQQGRGNRIGGPPDLASWGVDADEAAQLGDGGERADATVLSAVLLQADPGLGIYGLIVEVRRADGSRYQATVRHGFYTPERRDRVARAGADIPVRLDPNAPTRIALDRRALGFT
ncbi:MAG TPA: hypothetical protein VGN37_26140 [Actinocatenispora sp.]